MATWTTTQDEALFTMEGSLVASSFMDMLHVALMVGDPAPVVERMRQKMTHPLTGDRVVVFDSMFGKDDDTVWKGSGILLGTEPDNEWDKAWLIKYGPNEADVCRWTNCRVLAIPANEHFQ